MQARAQKTRDSILTAAAVVFERMGYAAATLEDIAVEADVSKGALYFHFPSKAAVAAAVIERHFARWPIMMREVAAQNLGTLDTLHALILTVARSFQEDPVARSGVRLGNEHLLIDAELPTPFVGWIEHITMLLRTGQDSGEVAPGVDCAAAARVIVASYFGIQEVSARLHDRKDLLDRIEEWWTLLAPSLVARPPSTRAQTGRASTTRPARAK